MPLRHWVLALSVLVCAALCRPVVAHAYDEQLSLDGALGYGLLAHRGSLPSNLAAVDLGAATGITDRLLLRGALGYGVLAEPDHATRSVGRARIEAAYMLDIVKWVPCFGLGTGLWLIEQRGEPLLRASMHAWLGVDYLLSRSINLGIDLRSGLLVHADSSVSFTELQLRVSRLFELF